MIGGFPIEVPFGSTRRPIETCAQRACDVTDRVNNLAVGSAGDDSPEPVSTPIRGCKADLFL